MQLRESGMKYMPALDGLRAVAILTVLAFHVFPAQLPGGFTGVDVFFVLSGFLISTLILTGLRERSFTLGGFYRNRIRRLLPNAVLVILVTVLLAHWLSLPSSGVLVARHAVWALFNLSNFFIRRYIGGYWGQAATTAPLVHTWSLAVEEQFYLVFPALLLLLARRRGLLVSLGLAGLASLALCVGLTHLQRGNPVGRNIRRQQEGARHHGIGRDQVEHLTLLIVAAEIRDERNVQQLGLFLQPELH